MPAKIQAAGDTIKIDKAFMSGKDRIKINGETVYEDKMQPDSKMEFSLGTRTYALSTQIVSKRTKAVVYSLQIVEQGELIHNGLYNMLGKPVDDVQQAKASGAVQLCAGICAVLGFVAMMVLNQVTLGAVPGGAIGGALGAGGGSAIGYGLGTLFFGQSQSKGKS